MRTAHLLTASQHALLGGVPAQGVYLPGGVLCGACTCLEGPAQEGYLPGGTCLVGVPAHGGLCARGCTCPGTPPWEQNDRQVQKYYLAPNFVCGW